MTQEEFIVSDFAMATHQRVVKGSMARAQIRGLDPIGSVAGNGLEELVRVDPEAASQLPDHLAVEAVLGEGAARGFLLRRDG